MNDEPNELHVRRRQKIQDDKDFGSSRVSESARYIGFGLAAATIALLTSDAAFAKKIIVSNEGLILAASSFGCATILLDYFQYISAYLSSEEAGQNKDGGYQYLTQSFWYRVRRWFFWTKQWSAVIGAVIFISVLLVTIHG
jgi:hypothetical protein